MKHIIIINGSGGVGKDTFVEFCSKYKKIENYSSVKEIKEVATILGWQGGKSDKDRKFLSDLKLLASNYSQFSFRCIQKKIESFMISNKDILFIHIRDIYEIEKVVEEYQDYNLSTLLITNHRIPHINSNPADANVYDYHYDYYIENAGSLTELDKKAEHFTSFLSKVNNR